MSSGTNYVSLPYSEVQAYSVPNDVVIPSGATQVGGIYYEWSENGFTGTEWFTSVNNGPTALWPFANDQAVNDYLNKLPEDQRNLNEVFAKWQNYLSELDDQTEYDYIEGFKDAVIAKGGVACAHY